jgi:hypothetical protein
MTGIAASAAAASMPGVDQILSAQCAAFLALLLAASAAHKWSRWQHTLGVAQDFAGVPSAAAPAAALGVGLAEWLAAGLLFLPAYRMLGALLAASILTVYLALIGRALIAGRRDIDCGCSFGSARRRLGAFEAGRNAVLAAVALFVAASTVHGGPAIAPSQGLAAAALLALYGALDQVMGLPPMRKGIVL